MGVSSRAQQGGHPAGRVPSVDLGATYADLKPEIDAAVARVLSSGRYIGGPEVEGLEREFAAFCGVPHAVAVASGTDALRFALMASGLPPATGSRNEVITSPLSFIATTEAISQVGGRPVFVDVDPESLTLDPALVRKALGPRTAAIVPVHLYGQVADMGPILELARQRGIAVVEDACQAHGAQYGGGGPGGAQSAGPAGGQAGRAGSLGDSGCFSFYPTKNLGGCGEGGMLTTRSADIAGRVRRLRDHGQSEKYVHPEEGYNGRLDALQAAILRVKLRRLAGWNERRRALAARYTATLRETGLAGRLILPVEKAWGRHVYHLYTVRLAGGGASGVGGPGGGPSGGGVSGVGAARGGATGRTGESPRDRLRAALLEKGIETGIHYPIPLHLQKAYAWMGLGEGSFPQAERASREVLSLPLYPEMTEAQVDRVCEALREVLGRT